MGRGHATTQFLSSTTGVHISTTAFASIEYDEATQTVTVGPGSKWEEVHAALHPYGVNVPGARVPGVGVGGFLLGGGELSLLRFSRVPQRRMVNPDATTTQVTHGIRIK